MIGTLRRELLGRILILNERHLRWILTIYLHHFNTARPHRTLGQLTPVQAETQPPRVINLADHQVRRRPILGGLTSAYQLAEKFDAVPHSELPAAGFPTDDGAMMTLADRTRLRVPHPYIAMVPQGDFRTLLAEAATTEKTLTLRMRTEMTGLIRDGGRVAGICY